MVPHGSIVEALRRPARLRFSFMIPGLSGSLLSHDALTGAFSGIGRRATTPNYLWFQTWHRRIVRDMGPTSTARHVYDRVALPLATATCWARFTKNVIGDAWMLPPFVTTGVVSTEPPSRH